MRRLYFRRFGSACNKGTFRGRIHTALLLTNRQINREARDYPLCINELWFQSPSKALEFFASVLHYQRHLATNLRLDVDDLVVFMGDALDHLIKQLGHLQVEHITITLKGGIVKEWFDNWDCFFARFEDLVHLKSFKLQIGSRVIKEAEKVRIRTRIEQSVLKLQELQRARERSTPGARSKFRELSIWNDLLTLFIGDQLANLSAIKAHAHRCQPRLAGLQTLDQEFQLLQSNLLMRYRLLHNYAAASGAGFPTVSIRLTKAYEAARAGKEIDFERLSLWIQETLDEQTDAMLSARRGLRSLPYNALSGFITMLYVRMMISLFLLRW